MKAALQHPADPARGRGGRPLRRLRQGLALLARTLSAWPWRATLHMLHGRFREDRLGVVAASLTFTTLIALVPLLTVMLAVFTAFPTFSGFESTLEKYFLQNLVPDNIARPVLRSLTQFAAKARGMGTAGLLLLAATALAMVLTIDRTLNAIWRVRKPRPIAQRVLVYWASLTLGPLVLGVSLSLTSYALSASRGFVAALPGGVKLVLELVQLGLLAVTVSGLFHFVPNTAVRWRHACAGGVFVALAFEAAKKALALYVDSVPTYSAVYGAFATVPILLLWVYLGWVIVLGGALIAACAPTLALRVAPIAQTPGWQFELALAVLQRLEAARHGPQHGLSLQALGAALKVDPLQIEPVVEVLTEIDWVSRLDEPGAARYVMLCDPERTVLAPLVGRTLLVPGAASAAFRGRIGFDRMVLAHALQH